MIVVYLYQMTLYKNIFTQEQLDYLANIIDNTNIPVMDGEYVSFDKNNGTGLCTHLGRLQIGNIKPSLSPDIHEALKPLIDPSLAMEHAMYVEYNAKYGQPNLPPHIDGDKNDLIINFQLSSNTSWDIGLGTETFTPEDNSALVFNGNTNVHWRPHKTFNEDEYVKMIFFRFYNPENPSDYSHISNNQTDPLFDDARAVRG